MATNIFQGILYPRFYYQRGKVSDRDWVFHRLVNIPEPMRAEVVTEYERLFMTANHQGRKSANTYLNGIYTECRQDARGANNG